MDVRRDNEAAQADVAAPYEALAPYYDDFTRDFAHDAWLAQLDRWVRSRGLRGSNLLDVACGTGKSFEPMLRRGYAVTACDLSPSMLEHARARAAGSARIELADMRCLEWRDEFDLVTCLDDSINHLVRPGDLMAALGSLAKALRPGGLALFDINALRTYRETFATRFEVRADRARFVWRGAADSCFVPGSTASATITVHATDANFETRHTERHWPIATVRRACAGAGFSAVSFRGQATGGKLSRSADERLYPKVVCLAEKS